MRTLVLAVMLALLPASGARADEWTWGDTAGEALFASAVAVDVTQTRWALAHGWRERNPLLGRYPSPARLIGSAALGVVAHGAVSVMLPSRARRAWQAVSLVAEVGLVVHSAAIGARVEF